MSDLEIDICPRSPYFAFSYNGQQMKCYTPRTITQKKIIVIRTRETAVPLAILIRQFHRTPSRQTPNTHTTASAQTNLFVDPRSDSTASPAPRISDTHRTGDWGNYLCSHDRQVIEMHKSPQLVRDFLFSKSKLLFGLELNVRRLRISKGTMGRSIGGI
ncbi:unnamed protein product [Nesidiocoris tenuis]|uniref:Uncharacterized protein n=1 Tax=Nesidiocoris tenuis TaxID=355587 RepID=A0A6H5GBV4_9HEMI|nr:unnamed protein product [Nesidiocoris tenuis]